MSNWQLPEGIDELTGDQANAFESARRALTRSLSKLGVRNRCTSND